MAVSGIMISSDNVASIQVFGKEYPEGRAATKQEELQIRDWVKTARFLGWVYKPSEVYADEGKIVIHVLRGSQPFQIKRVGRSEIELIDPMGKISILEQEELSAYLERLTVGRA